MAIKKKPERPDVPMAFSPSTKPPATVPTGDVPAYLDKFKGKSVKSNDNFDSTDITIPRVKLLQALSKEMETYSEAKPGMFWHTSMDLPLGPEIDFVVVSKRKKFLLVAPIDDGRGILARAEEMVKGEDGWDFLWNPSHGEFHIKLKGRKTPMIWKLAPTLAESGLGRWGTYNDEDENSPPAATLFYEYLSLLPERLDLGPVVISLTRSQIRKAKKGLNDKIQMFENAGRPMQSLVFKARVVKEEGQEGTFYNWQFTSNGFVMSEALFNSARELKDAMRTYKTHSEADEANVQEPKTQKGGDEAKDF